MNKGDWSAALFFVLSVCQNMTGVGSDWIGFVGFYLASACLFFRLLESLFPNLEGIWRLLLVVVIGSGAIALTRDSVREYIVRRHPHQDTKEELADTIAARLTMPAATPLLPGQVLAPTPVLQRPTSAAHRTSSTRVVDRQDLTLMDTQRRTQSLINRLTDSLKEYEKNRRWWESQPNLGAKAYQAMQYANQQDFDKKYKAEYKQQIQQAHNDLMGYIVTSPPTLQGTDRDQIYEEREVWDLIAPGAVEEQLCDICILLGEVQREHQMAVTCHPLNLMRIVRSFPQ